MCQKRSERFTASPFDAVALTMGDRSQLEALAQTFVSDNLRQYLIHSAMGLDKVDDRRWKVVKTKETLRVYSERSQRDMARRARKHLAAQASRTCTEDDEAEYSVSELPVMFSAGTLVGELDDVMFGVVSPTLELMRIKSSYVDDMGAAAVLATVTEPTLDDPFCSLVIKWMELDLPLSRAGLVKNRDFVYMEATGIVQLGHGGDRIGYHLMHSVHFPQTVDLPHKVRGRLSLCSFFRQTSPDIVEHYSSGTIDPGGVIPRALLVRATASQMLASLRYAYCGQMKKLTWMLQQKREEWRAGDKPSKLLTPERICVTCRSKAGGLFSSKCCICLGDLCMSCSIKKRLSFLSPESSLVRCKVSVCTSCMLEGLHVSASRAARDQLFGPAMGSAFATCLSETSSDLSVSPTAWSRSRCEGRPTKSYNANIMLKAFVSPHQLQAGKKGSLG
ncbi:Pyruvate kinase [Phytophthora cinnamomi]|uniref:Pyruvate kinase n=1 Tax=Phytophthora cinnamomi TaxID=4785 RepID=UPI0035595940|nr:Pyruvate kinase [Phytophthora cinnamomi]